MITREEMITQSVEDYISDGLQSRGYADDKVHVRDAFPSPEERASQLTQTQVALGFNFDDGGRQAEIGSDFRFRTYTIECWTFGIDQQIGANVASVIRAILEDSTYRLPLKDIGAVGQPVIDSLEILDDPGPTVTRQIAHDPMPWDNYVYTTTVKVEDFYSPSQVE